MVNQIEKLRKDEDIKALVFRINSVGQRYALRQYEGDERPEERETSRGING